MTPSQAGRQAGGFTARRELRCLTCSSRQAEVPHSETCKHCGTSAKGSQALPSPAAQPRLPPGSLNEWEGHFSLQRVGPALISCSTSKRNALLLDGTTAGLLPARPCFPSPRSAGKSPSMALGGSPLFGGTRIWLRVGTFAAVAVGQMSGSCSGSS